MTMIMQVLIRAMIHPAMRLVVRTARISSAVSSALSSAIFPISDTEKRIRDLYDSINHEDIVDASHTVRKLLPFKKSPPCPFSDMECAYAYKDDLVRELIWHIKYKKTSMMLDIAVTALYATLCSFDNLKKFEHIILIPIPISKSRRKERGYNQCELLCKLLYKSSCEVWAQKIRYDKNLLIRKSDRSKSGRKSAKKQAFKNRTERIASTRDIFSVSESPASEKLVTRSETTLFVIIDDVITTGSTMRSAIDTLHNAGFANVIGIAVAH